MTRDETKFINELETVSRLIAAWAQEQLNLGCSLSEVKRKLLQIGEVARRC